jgi:hypothetical protein
MENVWQLIGPTIERNINQPLWAQFCAIYLEGMAHAAGCAADAALKEST